MFYLDTLVKLAHFQMQSMNMNLAVLVGNAYFRILNMTIMNQEKFDFQGEG